MVNWIELGSQAKKNRKEQKGGGGGVGGVVYIGC